MSKAIFSLSLLLAGLAQPVFAGEKAAAAPNGIQLPTDYADWRLIAPAYRHTPVQNADFVFTKPVKLP